eukprot:7238441-Prymnesium_polylepis.2
MGAKSFLANRTGIASDALASSDSRCEHSPRADDAHDLAGATNVWVEPSGGCENTGKRGRELSHHGESEPSAACCLVWIEKSDYGKLGTCCLYFPCCSSGLRDMRHCTRDLSGPVLLQIFLQRMVPETMPHASKRSRVGRFCSPLQKR